LYILFQLYKPAVGQLFPGTGVLQSSHRPSDLAHVPSKHRDTFYRK